MREKGTQAVENFRFVSTWIPFLSRRCAPLGRE
jgi:hypothetical protein